MVFLARCILPSLSFNGELAEQECPDECDCHYFRINWVTDCSNSNLTQIPYDELSMNVYVLDLNDNLISEIQPFPPDIKMRRLQMANNLMLKLKKNSFKGMLRYFSQTTFNLLLLDINVVELSKSAGFRYIFSLSTKILSKIS